MGGDPQGIRGEAHPGKGGTSVAAKRKKVEFRVVVQISLGGKFEGVRTEGKGMAGGGVLPSDLIQSMGAIGKAAVHVSAAREGRGTICETGST